MSAPIRDVSELNALDAFDTIPDPIMILDPKGIIRHANKAFSEKLSQFSKDTIGNHFLDIGLLVDMTEAAKKKAKQRFNLALRKKSLPSAEYRFERKDDEPTYYLTNISIIEDSNGEVEYAIVFMREITEQIEKRISLKRHQSELRLILDSTPARIWFKDTENNILRVNKSAAASIGLTPADVEGKATADLFPELAEKYHQDDIEVIKSQEPKLGIIEPLITPTGDTYWVKTDKIPTRDDSGKIDGLIVIAEDITDIKLIQDELEKTQNELAIMARISDIFLTSTEDKMFADVLDVALDATKSEHGIFGYVNSKGDLVCPSLTRIIWDRCQMEDKAVIFPRDVWGGIWGNALIEKKTLLSNESFKVPKGHLPMNRGLDVPIIYDNEVIGNLLIGNKKEDYTEYDVELLEKISEHLSPVLNGWLLRRRTERDLRIKDQSIASAQNAITIANLEGIVTYVNQSFLRMWGHDSNEEIIGKPFSSFSKNPKAIRPMMSKLMEQGYVQFETIATHTDGLKFDIEASIQLVRSEDGTPISIMASMTDISDRKQAEKESELMKELMTGLNIISTEKKTAKLVLQKAIQVEGIDSGGVYVAEKETGAFILLSHTGLSDEFVNQIRELGPDSPQAQLVRSGNPFYAPYEIVPGVDDPQMREGLRSIAIIPIKHEEEVLAVLNLASHTHSEIPERSRGFIESLGLQLGEVFKRVIAVSDLHKLNLELEDRVITRTSELEFERDKAQTYLDISQIIMLALDKDGIVTLINQKGCEVLGSSSEEIIGKNWFESFLPTNLKKRGQNFTPIIKGEIEKIAYSESIILTSQNEERIIAWRDIVLKDEVGSIIGMLSAGEDITERKQTEEALRDSERRLRLSYDYAAIGMLWLNVDGIFLRVNKSFSELVGYTAGELREMNVQDLTHPEDSEIGNSNMKKLVSGELGRGPIEMRYIHKNGNFIHVQLHSAFIKNDVEGRGYFFTQVEDITEQKQAEEALAKYTHNLSERVKEQTCLYETSKLVSSEEPIENILQKIVVLIPPAWQFPDIACARLVYKDNEYTTMNFKESKWKQSAAITPSGLNMGNLEVYYLEERPTIDEGPFLKEERALIEALAENVTRLIERREAEERYHTLFAEAPIALAATDTKGRIINANLSLLSLTGYASTELEGMNISILYSNQVEREQVNKVLDDTEVIHDFEATLVQKDGTVFNAQLDIDLRGDEALVAIRDITDRKQAEEALRESEERFRAVFDTMLNGYAYCKIVTDDKGKPIDFIYLDINNSFEKLTGLKPKDVIGKRVTEAIPGIKEETPEIFDIYGKVALTGEPTEFEIDFTPFDKWYKVTVTSHQRGYFAVIFADITESKNAVQELRESEDRFRSTFDESPIALEILDADGIVIRANQACKEMFGLSSPDDLIGFCLFDDPNLHEDHKDSLRRNVIVREDLPFDFNLVKESNLYPSRKSGKLFLRTIFAPLGIKPDGSKSGYLVQLADITDQIIAEQAIREANEKLNLLNEELETRVEIRTKELRDAQEELVRAERLTTLGQISGGVGHELRNPLGAIKNATYFLKIMMETPTSEIKETLEILDKEVENCEKIINSLLDFARPTEPVLQKVDIVELIQGVLKRIEIPENINVQSKFPKTTPIILGDPHQLERVFLNLVTNSIQAMSDGGTLTLRTGRKDGNLQIFVQDTGIGIPEDSMRKLFEPLFTTKAKGIGLGLSIVKALVESHKGEISVESEVGKGTTFMIQIPNPNRRS